MSKMRNISQDRISELPQNLIEYILEKISIKEAARTSILSTKWRYIWNKMPKLVLDKQFLEGLALNKRTESSQFVQVVDTILMVHNGTIHKFKIYIPFSQTPNMDLWILYLSRNGVKKLTLRNSFRHQSYKLPSYIFSCDQLTYLSLYNCFLNTPLQCKGFCHLRELFLMYISLSANTGTLISTLPSLVNLSLSFCTGVENINNLPPNLSWFRLNAKHEFKWQWFQNKTKLSHLCIPHCKEVKNVDLQGKIFKLNYFLSNLPNLRILELGGFALKCLAAGDFTEFHQFSHKLKQIKLLSLRFDDLDQVSSALCLLRSSPKLENLEIQASLNSNDELEQHDLSYIVNIADSDLKLNCLRSAILEPFLGLKAELAFVKLILSHSPTLQQMKIVCRNLMEADTDLAVSMQLMRFRRASVEAEIIYTRGEIDYRRKFPV